MKTLKLGRGLFAIIKNLNRGKILNIIQNMD
jgi:hypothetical protein